MLLPLRLWPRLDLLCMFVCTFNHVQRVFITAAVHLQNKPKINPSRLHVFSGGFTVTPDMLFLEPVAALSLAESDTGCRTHK